MGGRGEIVGDLEPPEGDRLRKRLISPGMHSHAHMHIHFRSFQHFVHTVCAHADARPFRRKTMDTTKHTGADYMASR